MSNPPKILKLPSMGLMFQLPVEENKLDDRVILNEEQLVLRSYGLPMIFWGYLAAIFMVMFFMGLAIKGPITTILTSDDMINRALAYAVLAIFILGPIILLSFYFYEKELVKSQQGLTIRHKLFYLPIKSTHIPSPYQLELVHFLDSPNMAKAKKQQGMAAFENRGYYQVFAKRQGKPDVLVDRNSRKGEMKKLIELLNRYP